MRSPNQPLSVSSATHCCASCARMHGKATRQSISGIQILFIRLLSRELLERGCRTLGRTHRVTLCQKHLGKQSGEPGELNFCFTSQLQNAGKNIQLRQLCGDAARSQVAELEVQSIAQCDTPIEKDLTGQGQPARFFLAPLRGAKSTTER